MFQCSILCEKLYQFFGHMCLEVCFFLSFAKHFEKVLDANSKVFITPSFDKFMKICCDFPLCKSFKKPRQDYLSKEKKRICLGALTPQARKKRSKSIRDDDGGNDFLYFNSLRDGEDFDCDY